MIIDARNQVTNPAGNRPQDPGNVIGVAIHHSVSGDYLGPDATTEQELAHIRAIDQYHVGLDYGGFGYHTAVFASGRAYRCGEGQRAHVAKRNHQLRGVVAIGTFTDRLPGQRQMDGILEAIRWHFNYLGRAVGVDGHGTWALPGQGTGCPGQLDNVDWEQLLAVPPVEEDALTAEQLNELGMQRARGYLIDALLRDYEVVPVDEPGNGVLIVELRRDGQTPISVPVLMRPEVRRGE